MKIRHFLFGLMLVCALTACSSDKSKKDDDTKKEEEADQKLPICPQTAAVHELDTMRDYGAEKPDPAQLVAAARVDGVSGTCSYGDDGIDLSFTIHFEAARGPRLGGNRMEFPFFVAIADPAGNVTAKNQMTVAFKFSRGDATATDDEDMHVFIPLPKKQWKSGPDYRVLAGFQLTEEQLNDVRKKEDAAR